MHDQPRIVFLVPDVIDVVMNAMAVKGQRRITEQQYGVAAELALPCRSRWRRFALRRRLVRRGCIAINNIGFLAHRDFIAAADHMAHGSEYGIAGWSVLCVHGFGL